MGKITKAERQAMEEFRDLSISLEELRPLIRRRASFNFRPGGLYTRGIQKHADPAEPGIPVTVKHLDAAYLKLRKNELAADELSNWASMLLMNDDYDIADSPSDIIAEWLNCAVENEVGPIIKG